MAEPRDDQSQLRLAEENAALRLRLADAEDTLRALRSGEVDAILVGEDVYVLEGAETAANRFRSDVLSQMEDAVIVLDTEGHVVYINAAAERQYGVPSVEALGRPQTALFSQEWDSDTDEQAARQALEDNGFWRGRCIYRTPTGRRLFVECSNSRLRDARGNLAGLLVVARDFSVQAAGESALAASRARLQFALESARIGEWDLDLESDSSVRSQRHDLCFGYTRPVPRWGLATFKSHLHPADLMRVEQTVNEALGWRDEMHLECRVIWPDGGVHWIEVHATVFRQGGKPRSMAGIVADVSERKFAEEALRDADRRKDVFLATLAHELRNPMAPISNSLAVMRRSESPALHAQAMATVEKQLAHLVRLVDDLLDVSRISQGKMTLRLARIDVAEVLQSAIDSVFPRIEQNQHRLEVQWPESPIAVDGDMTRLTQALTNVLDNAAKYTPEGGLIQLAARREFSEVVISVRDNGSGIHPANLGQVFELFTQVGRTRDHSQGGMGIGLALVKRLVEMHSGTVHARSAGEGRGTTVILRLPLPATAASVAQAQVMQPATATVQVAAPAAAPAAEPLPCAPASTELAAPSRRLRV
ncbi:MAG: PAS domain-containing sensor histidine kinase, partial [Burkholderiaceae bacterium]